MLACAHPARVSLRPAPNATYRSQVGEAPESSVAGRARRRVDLFRRAARGPSWGPDYLVEKARAPRSGGRGRATVARRGPRLRFHVDSAQSYTASGRGVMIGLPTRVRRYSRRPAGRDKGASLVRSGCRVAAQHVGKRRRRRNDPCHSLGRAAAQCDRSAPRGPTSAVTPARRDDSVIEAGEGRAVRIGIPAIRRACQRAHARLAVYPARSPSAVFTSTLHPVRRT